MKSILLMDIKDCEENIIFLQKQIQLYFNTTHVENLENLQTNYYKTISTTA